MNVNEQIAHRLETYIYPSISGRFFIYKDLIDGHIRIFYLGNGGDFKEAKVTQNNYHHISGKEITTEITAKWASTYMDGSSNTFRIDIFKQNISLLPISELMIPPNSEWKMEQRHH